MNVMPSRPQLCYLAFWLSVSAFGFSLAAFSMGLVALLLEVNHHG